MRCGGTHERLVVTVGAVALTIVMTYPLAFGLDRLGRFDSGDGQFSIWVVGWVARTLVRDPLHLFDANIFYPHRGTLAYSESNLLAGLLGVPAYWASGSAIVAHNSVVLLSFVLSALATYALARHLTGSRPASAIAAILFAFCPFVYAHLPHIQLLMTASLPFTLWAFHRVVDAPRPARAVTLAAALLMAGLSSGYYGVFAAIMVSAGGIYYLVTRRRWRSREYGLSLGSAAVLAAVAIWPVLSRYRHLQGEDGTFRSLDVVRTLSANLAAYLAAAGWGNRWLTGLVEGWTDVLFPGLVTLALAAVGLWHASRPPKTAQADADALHPPARETVVFYGLLGLLFVWLSLGPAAGLYQILYEHVPFMTFLRAPVRFGVVVTLCLAVLGAVGVSAIVRGRRHGGLVAAALGLCALVELAPLPLPLREMRPIARAFQMLASLPDGAVAEFPFYYRPANYFRHAEYMLYSTYHWKPLLNGYSDYYPADYRSLAATANQFPTPEGLRALRNRRTRYVVFHRRLYDQPSEAALMDRIARHRAHLRPLYVDDRVLLYELLPSPVIR